jgi:hypothetical protein
MRPGGLAWIGNRARTSLLDFVRGLNPEQFRAIDRCGSWAAARVPTLEDAVQPVTGTAALLKDASSMYRRCRRNTRVWKW